jgi:hypothetical protein
MRSSGSGAWGVGEISASMLDGKTKKTLWTSRTFTGHRTIFHGYASPFQRAVSGIVKEMRAWVEKASPDEQSYNRSEI